MEVHKFYVRHADADPSTPLVERIYHAKDEDEATTQHYAAHPRERAILHSRDFKAEAALKAEDGD